MTQFCRHCRAVIELSNQTMLWNALDLESGEDDRTWCPVSLPWNFHEPSDTESE